MKEIDGDLLAWVYEFLNKKYGENSAKYLEKHDMCVYTIKEFLNDHERSYSSMIYYDFLNEIRDKNVRITEWDLFWEHSQKAVKLWEELKEKPMEYLNTIKRVIEETQNIYDDVEIIFDIEKEIIVEFYSF